jgi:fucose permease
LVPIDRRFRFIFFALLGTFATFGVTVTLVGATLPKVLDSFKWSYTATGLVLCSGSVGYFVSSFCCGMLAQRFGPKPVLALGLLVQGLGLSVFLRVPSIPVNLALYVAIGVGHGAVEVVVNYCVVRMERGGQSRLMSLMHAAFCVGGVAGPLVTMAVLDVWPVMYRAMAAMSIGLAVLAALLPLSRLRRSETDGDDDVPVRRLLRCPLLILAALILFVYVGSELGVSDWISVFYVRELGASEQVGAMMVAVFWFGLLLGRLGVSVLYHGSRQAVVLVVLAATTVAGLYMALAMPGAWLAGAGFFVAGLGYSAIYPLTMTVVGRHFGGHGAALGFAATGGGVGSFTMKYALGAVNERHGVRGGFGLLAALNVVMLVLTLLALWRVRVLEREPLSTQEGMMGRNEKSSG